MARALLREMGGEFTQVYLIMGGHDMEVVYEAPDDATAAPFSLVCSVRPHDRAQVLP